MYCSQSTRQRSSVKVLRTVVRNTRSVCGAAVISLFVLFLTTSAPHRVHHLFENLSRSGKVLKQQVSHHPAHIHSLSVSKQNVDDRKHDHQVESPAKNGHYNRGHPHHGHLSHSDDHEQFHGKWHHGEPQSSRGTASSRHEDIPVSGAPLRANSPHDDAHHDNSAQTVCLLQSATQHSHLSAAELVEISFRGIESQERPDPSSLGFSTFNPSPFSQRAPPIV
jgi:hypothetical protein